MDFEMVDHSFSRCVLGYEHWFNSWELQHLTMADVNCINMICGCGMLVLRFDHFEEDWLGAKALLRLTGVADEWKLETDRQS